MVKHAEPSDSRCAPAHAGARCAPARVRREEVGPDARRRRRGDWRRGRGGGGHDKRVEIAEEVEVGGEEDVEEAGLDEVRRAGDRLCGSVRSAGRKQLAGREDKAYLALVAGLHNRSVLTRDRVGQRREVGEEHAVCGELVAQDVKEHELLCRQKLRRGEVRCEG